MAKLFDGDRDEGEDPTVFAELHIHAVTAKAVLVSEEGDEDQAKWVPKSQIVEGNKISNGDRGDVIELELQRWIAEREGFI